MNPVRFSAVRLHPSLEQHIDRGDLATVKASVDNEFKPQIDILDKQGFDVEMKGYATMDGAIKAINGPFVQAGTKLFDGPIVVISKINKANGEALPNPFLSRPPTPANEGLRIALQSYTS